MASRRSSVDASPFGVIDRFPLPTPLLLCLALCPLVCLLARTARIPLFDGEISQASLTLGGRQFNGLLDGSEQFVQIDWLVQIGVGA